MLAEGSLLVLSHVLQVWVHSPLGHPLVNEGPLSLTYGNRQPGCLQELFLLGLFLSNLALGSQLHLGDSVGVRGLFLDVSFALASWFIPELIIGELLYGGTPWDGFSGLLNHSSD